MITKKLIASTIDHTYLDCEDQGVTIDEQKTRVESLVNEAAIHGAYSVCVRESMVSFAKQCVQDRDVKICSVIAFPDPSKYSTQQKIELLEKAREDGADEFDMVMNFSQLKANKDEDVYQDIHSVCEAAKKEVLKVIFENCMLVHDEKLRAYQLCARAFLDAPHNKKRFFKTSTGFASPPPGKTAGATLEDVKLMHQVSKGRFGIKPAGGISNFEQAIEFYEAVGAPKSLEEKIDVQKFRIGSSSLLLKLFS